MSVIFLKRKLYLYQWVSLLVVMAGVFLVGLSGYLIEKNENILAASGTTLAPLSSDTEKKPTAKVILGICMVLAAQCLSVIYHYLVLIDLRLLSTASQFVVEEKIMSLYSFTPMTGVALEGLFGSISVFVLFPIFFKLKSRFEFFDVARGWEQVTEHGAVMWAVLASAASIGFANYFGMSLTRHSGATTRSLADTCRTLVVWIVSLGLGWEKLAIPGSLLQMIGFAGLVYGTVSLDCIFRRAHHDQNTVPLQWHRQSARIPQTSRNGGNR